MMSLLNKLTDIVIVTIISFWILVALAFTYYGLQLAWSV
jgi:hypothetical protein